MPSLGLQGGSCGEAAGQSHGSRLRARHHSCRVSELPCAGGFRHQMDTQKARKRVVERRAKECRWNGAERTQRRPGSGRLPLHTPRSFGSSDHQEGDREPSPVSFKAEGPPGTHPGGPCAVIKKTSAFRCSEDRCKPSGRRRSRAPGPSSPGSCRAARPPGRRSSGSTRSPGT